MMTFDFITQQQKELFEDISKGKFDKLEIMHHLTSGFKSYLSQTTNDGLYSMRQAIGGAGYTVWSGIPSLIDHFNPVVTYEGDNTMLLQQAAKYLMKLHKRVSSGEKA